MTAPALTRRTCPASRKRLLPNPSASKLSQIPPPQGPIHPKPGHHEAQQGNQNVTPRSTSLPPLHAAASARPLCLLSSPRPDLHLRCYRWPHRRFPGTPGRRSRSRHHGSHPRSPHPHPLRCPWHLPCSLAPARRVRRRHRRARLPPAAPRRHSGGTRIYVPRRSRSPALGPQHIRHRHLRALR